MNRGLVVCLYSITALESFVRTIGTCSLVIISTKFLSVAPSRCCFFRDCFRVSKTWLFGWYQSCCFQHGGPSSVAATFWPRFESELEHEMNVKERELDWLQKIGSDIQPRLTEDQQQGLKRHHIQSAHNFLFLLQNIQMFANSRYAHIQFEIIA